MCAIVIAAKPPANIMLSIDRESLEPRFKTRANFRCLGIGRSVQILEQVFIVLFVACVCPFHIIKKRQVNRHDLIFPMSRPSSRTVQRWAGIPIAIPDDRAVVRVGLQPSLEFGLLRSEVLASRGYPEGDDDGPAGEPVIT